LSPVAIIQPEKPTGKENLNVLRRIILELERRSKNEKRKSGRLEITQTNNKNDVL
jgi:hypothetical protein